MLQTGNENREGSGRKSPGRGRDGGLGDISPEEGRARRGFGKYMDICTKLGLSYLYINRKIHN